MPSYRLNSKPASDAEIVAFEEVIGNVLPDDYRSFLRSINGGVPSPDCFLDENGLVNRVLLFYPLDVGHDQSLQSEFSLASGEIPKSLIPIGKDAGSEPICLNTDKDGFGQLVCTDGYVEDTGEGIKFRRISDSFDRFIDSLFAVPEETDEMEIFAKQGRPNDLDMFLSLHRMQIDDPGRRGLTITQFAARCGNRELLEECIKRGARTRRVVHQALRNRRWEIARYLASLGVDLNEIDEHGARSSDLIHGIFGERRQELINFLRQHGAIFRDSE